MRKVLGILCLLFCLYSCNSDDSSNDPVVPEPEIVKAPLTVLAYMVANNNLDDDLYENIVAMYQGLQLLDKPATLLVYWDGKTPFGENNVTHAILRFETDGEGNINGLPALDESYNMDVIMATAEVVKEYSTQMSASKHVMTNVLKDMLSLAPANRYGLIFGSHASAWTNSIFTSRSFGQDGPGTDNTILLPDMVEAIRSTGVHFDYILFDACYMGTIEVCYDFKDVADYLIASVMEVPAYGFPYATELMPALFEGTEASYKKICQEFISFYTDFYTQKKSAWGTVALINSKEVNSLVSSLKNEIISHKDKLADYDVSSLQEYGKSSGPDIAYDLRQFVKELNDGNIPTDFDEKLNKAVLYKGCLTEARPANYAVDVENYCGLGIYIPVSSRTDWNDYFKTIDWFSASGWNEVTFAWNF